MDRIRCVINYDAPGDVETYIHRIGRTGRAGRQGHALLFLAPNQTRLLRMIEDQTNSRILPLELPSTAQINHKRIARFAQRLTDTLDAGGLESLEQIVNDYQRRHEVPMARIAAAFARLVQGDKPLLLQDLPPLVPAGKGHQRTGRAKPRQGKQERSPRTRRSPSSSTEAGMERYRLKVGHAQGLLPKNIVGAIAAESGLAGRDIGRITIDRNFSTVDLPEGMPSEIFQRLQRLRFGGRASGFALDSPSGPPKSNAPKCTQSSARSNLTSAPAKDGSNRPTRKAKRTRSVSANPKKISKKAESPRKRKKTNTTAKARKLRSAP